jgi:hypothetical protein
MTRTKDSKAVCGPNGRTPVSVSYKTTPKENTSVRLSAAFPSMISGAMYPGLPITAPLCVIVVDACTRASPKSTSFTPSPASRKMLSGLMSLCITSRE